MGVQGKSGCGKWKVVIEGLAEHGQPSVQEERCGQRARESGNGGMTAEEAAAGASSAPLNCSALCALWSPISL